MYGGYRSAGVRARAAALLCAAFATTAWGSNCPSSIEDESRADVVANPPGYDIDVYFTTDAGSDMFNATTANRVRDSIPNAITTLTDATRNFKSPSFSDDPQDTCIFDSENLATAPEWGYTVDAPGMINDSEPLTRAILGHETFHHAEYAYIDFDEWPEWGGWTIEATARAMEDKMWLDNDTTPGNTLFLGEVNNYLGNPNRTLMDISYTAALFWTYLTEQLGTAFPEPARGVDFIQRFWSFTEDNDPDSVQYLRDTISSFDSDATLEDEFLDFAVTNYTHDLDVSALPNPARYSYFDESAAGGGTAYNAVPRTPVVTFNTPISDSVVRWGAKYYEVIVPKDQICEAIGFWGKAKNGVSVGWALVGLKGGKVTELYRATGNEFYRALINPVTEPYDKLALVVTGLNNAADFDYAFGFGPTSGAIRLPTLDRMAYVGDKSDPERFQLRLFMQGPSVLTPSGSGTLSLRGIDPTLFDVKLRSVATGNTYAATVLNASYVSGEYWMAVQAPVITNALDGDLYDVQICFCKRSGTCAQTLTSANSVLYAKITLNQMMVLDRSFSMHYPTTDPKIEAAKNAARIYVNAAQDDDRLGLVTFNGDNAECNDDAVTNFVLSDVAPSRAGLLTSIDGIVEDGWTSIGDGLKHGRDALFAAGSPSDLRSLVLMSDGRENEGDYWGSSNGACATPAVKDSFDPALGGPASDMRIDSIAFGADADQSLLQNIAVFTNGEYYAVSTDAPAESVARAGATAMTAATTSSLQVPNRLANVYRSIEEGIRRQDRLYSTALDVSGGGGSVNIPVTEKQGGGLRDATFAINWDAAGAGVNVNLLDPNGVVINPGSPGWQVLTGTTDKVYQYSGLLDPGDWQVQVSAAGSGQALVMLSGSVVRGVDLDTWLSAISAPLPQQCERTTVAPYMRGMPVNVIANLNDSLGGIHGANVEASVENPDGSTNTLVLFDDGNHDDGVAGDGVYANRYSRTPFFSNAGVPDFPGGPPTGVWGSYNVQITAEGKSHYEEAFQRTQLRAFQVYEFTTQDHCNPDADGDGLPDRWENYYGLDPSNPADAGDDNDLDGIKNKDEFYYGTNPFDADTDDGGEADGSEVAAGRDPLYQYDDLLPALVDYGVVTQRTDLPVHEPQPKTNILHFPVNPAYTGMEIWRTDPGWFGFQQVKVIHFTGAPEEGIFYDDGLVVGFTYQYYLVAQGQSGAKTARTDTFAGTPKSDALPPKGWIRINNAQLATPTLNVKVQLDKGIDTTEVLVSERADFQGAVWQPITSELSWVLSAQPMPFTAWIYAKFRDAALNESIVYHDSIVVDPNADNDGDGFIDTLDNCTLVANPDQRDSNGDGYGNLCDPDLDNDGVVNFVDLGLLKSAFFSSDADADLNGDGVVNFVDAGIIKGMFFLPPGPSGLAP